MAGRIIEDVINEVLEGSARANATDFIAYLRANGIPLEESEEYWDVKYKDKSICYLWINGSDEMPGPWTIWSDQEPGTWAAWGDKAYVDYPVDAHTKKIAWANVNVCGNCGGCDNPGGMRKTVLGKAFDNLCNSTMAFTNPDTEALDCAKKMIDIRKQDILNQI